MSSKESFLEHNGLTIGNAIALIIFLIGALVGTTVWAYSTFVTKEYIEKRLDSIDSELRDLNSYLRK